MEFSLEPVSPKSVAFRQLQPSDTFICVKASKDAWPEVFMAVDSSSCVSLQTGALTVIEDSIGSFNVIRVKLDVGEISYVVEG